MQIEIPRDLRFLSELYAKDAHDAVLLTEYPSSNSDQTIFQNETKFIIHDPFPPPPRELLTSLGPHHLMYCWGGNVPVTSQLAPPERLLDHWERVFGHGSRPVWKPFAKEDSFITLFPHQSLSAEQQVIDPVTNYRLHSKEVIEKIDCPQADVLKDIEFPCIAKLSHGYAGLGNFLIQSESDEQAMREELAKHWPNAILVVNSIIENIVGDYGVQFYLHRDGSIVWLGLTEQKFNDDSRWCGGTYSTDLQTGLLEPFTEIVLATADHLHRQGYFGVVGVDILRDRDGSCFLVDVNPRLTGITPFLMASRIFNQEDGLTEGIYQASFRFEGALDALIQSAESHEDCRVTILSAFEQTSGDRSCTICHISVSSKSQSFNRKVLDELAKT
jgi:hypothetical protein